MMDDSYGVITQGCPGNLLDTSVSVTSAFQVKEPTDFTDTS